MNEQEPLFPIRGDLMRGKRGLIMGVANNRSIAWAIAQAVAAQGGECAFTYQGETLEKRVRPLAASIGSDLVLPCDVGKEDELDSVFAALQSRWSTIDFLVHAIGFADKQYLRGRFADTPRAQFLQAIDISCYSFVGAAQRAAALMPRGGSLLTMTYLGSQRVMPHYNVMGVAKAALEASVRYLAADFGTDEIRVNAISAGPIKTLAASGIGDFTYILKWNQYNSPMQRNVLLEEVGSAGLYLLSDLSRGVTGNVHLVDCGYHVIGMKNANAPDISKID
jgi:enoyl-[acyl-carrier protein] reductase I